MRTSEQISDLIAALTQARLQFKPITKNKLNPHYDQRYTDLSEILEAVSPALAAHGLILTGGPEPQDDGSLLVCTRLYHTSGQWLESSMRIERDKIQVLGSGITYARRYTTAALLGVAGANDDDDGQTAQQAERPTRRQPARRESSSATPPPPGSQEGKGLLLQEILATMRRLAPGQDPASRDARASLIRTCFGVAGWKEVGTLSLDALQAGYATLQTHLAPEDAPADDPAPEAPSASGKVATASQLAQLQRDADKLGLDVGAVIQEKIAMYQRQVPIAQYEEWRAEVRAKQATPDAAQEALIEG